MDILSYTLGKKAGGGSAPVLQDKEVTITENGETEITADSGYDGLSSVNVTTDVPAGITPTGTINITTNGTHDVTTYASANVNVPSQKYAPRYIKFTGYKGTDLDYEIANLDTSNITAMSSMFQSLSEIETLNLSNFDTSSVTDMSSMFDNCPFLISVGTIKNWNTSNLTTIRRTFFKCSALTSLDLSGWKTSNVTTMEMCFFGDSNLTSLNLSSWTSEKISSAITNLSQMFSGCSSLQFLDIRNFNFTMYASHGNMFNSVPVDCEIIVKDNTQKSWFTTYWPSLTNVKTVAEYEGN